MDGRYGPYVKWGKVNATLPKDHRPEESPSIMATALIAEKAAKKGKGSQETRRKQESR